MSRSVPSKRIHRAARTGQTIVGVAANIVGNAAREALSGKRPDLRDLALTPGNARRLASHLKHLRGAAMKVGQLLSLDSGNLLPAEFSAALQILREDASPMPILQVNQVLEGGWGKNWEQEFEYFNFTPIAAASIGQVHEARLNGGERIAIKIQYPGVRESIDSDISNIASLLRVFKILPADLELAPLLEEARQQLHAEADYLQEAEHIDEYARHLGADAAYELPNPLTDRVTPEILPMTFLQGEPVESLTTLNQTERDAIGCALVRLALNEILRWGRVQTDPNFANYRYSSDKHRLQLFDFGATRVYPAETVGRFRTLVTALAHDDQDTLHQATQAVGYLSDQSSDSYRSSVTALLRCAAEPLLAEGPYNFGQSELAQRMKGLVVHMRMTQQQTEIPPTELLYLHRKIGGLYLLLHRLRARVDVRQQVLQILESTGS